MNIIVCVKRVPATQEADLEIDESNKNIHKDNLAWFINEWDNYAMEEAVLIKEKSGGTVTAVTVGNEDDEEVLRRCLAIGADKAIRIDPGELTPDPFGIGKILADTLKDLEYDLILTGVQADDNNYGMIGPIIAEHLDIPHISVVTEIRPEGESAIVKVELEDGIDQVVKIHLPSLLTIQTGINEPRYVSIMGIRKASKKELLIKTLDDLNISPDDITDEILIDNLFLPPETEGAEMIEGDPEETAEKIISLIREKGVSI